MQTQGKYSDEELAAMVRQLGRVQYEDYLSFMEALRARGVAGPAVHIHLLTQRLRARGRL